MGAKQGLENVVEAARLADAASLPIRFVLLGAGNRRAALAERAKGIERIQFLDPLPDGQFETALAAADLLVLNERPEVAEMCVPSKLTSYFASGRPVVAATSERGAASREITASGAGLRVSPGDPSALLDAALAMGMDVEAAAVMGRRGTTYAQATLSEDAARASYVAWVDGLMAPLRGIPSAPVQRVPEHRVAATVPAAAHAPMPRTGKGRPPIPTNTAGASATSDLIAIPSPRLLRAGGRPV